MGVNIEDEQLMKMFNLTLKIIKIILFFLIMIINGLIWINSNIRLDTYERRKSIEGSFYVCVCQYVSKYLDVESWSLNFLLFTLYLFFSRYCMPTGFYFSKFHCLKQTLMGSRTRWRNWKEIKEKKTIVRTHWLNACT